RPHALPLSFAGAHAPAAGDAQRTRDVVADAVLAHVARQDYLHSEFGRSYDDLVHEFRRPHVDSVRDFRAAPDDVFTATGDPNQVIYLGAWLGAHTEVTVDV